MTQFAFAIATRTTIIGLIGSSLLIVSEVNATTNAYLKYHCSAHVKEKARIACWLYHYNSPQTGPRTVFVSRNQNGFGSTTPWQRSGIEPDDWRQSVNGN
jgi:hypothetical protein